MRLKFLILSLVFIVSWSSLGHAQNQSDDAPQVSVQEIQRWQGSVDRLTRDYENRFVELKRSKKKFFNGHISSLRAMYPRTRYYAPFAENLIKDMEKYAFIVDTSEDNSAVNDALFMYNDLLDKHIVNLDVLAFAIKMTN